MQSGHKVIFFEKERQELIIKMAVYTEEKKQISNLIKEFENGMLEDSFLNIQEDMQQFGEQAKILTELIGNMKKIKISHIKKDGIESPRLAFFLEKSNDLCANIYKELIKQINQKKIVNITENSDESKIFKFLLEPSKDLYAKIHKELIEQINLNRNLNKITEDSIESKLLKFLLELEQFKYLHSEQNKRDNINKLVRFFNSKEGQSLKDVYNKIEQYLNNEGKYLKNEYQYLKNFSTQFNIFITQNIYQYLTAKLGIEFTEDLALILDKFNRENVKENQNLFENTLTQCKNHCDGIGKKYDSVGNDFNSLHENYINLYMKQISNLNNEIDLFNKAVEEILLKNINSLSNAAKSLQILYQQYDKIQDKQYRFQQNGKKDLICKLNQHKENHLKELDEIDGPNNDQFFESKIREYTALTNQIDKLKQNIQNINEKNKSEELNTFLNKLIKSIDLVKEQYNKKLIVDGIYATECSKQLKITLNEKKEQKKKNIQSKNSEEIVNSIKVDFKPMVDLSKKISELQDLAEKEKLLAVNKNFLLPNNNNAYWFDLYKKQMDNCQDYNNIDKVRKTTLERLLYLKQVYEGCCAYEKHLLPIVEAEQKSGKSQSTDRVTAQDKLKLCQAIKELAAPKNIDNVNLDEVIKQVKNEANETKDTPRFYNKKKTEVILTANRDSFGMKLLRIITLNFLFGLWKPKPTSQPMLYDVARPEDNKKIAVKN